MPPLTTLTVLRDAVPRPPPASRLVSWLPWAQPNSSLIGHATVAFNSGWIINSIPVFRRKDGSCSAGSPSMPVLDREDRHKIGDDGKKLYAALIVFEGGGRDLWNRAVMGALADDGIAPANEGAP